MISEVINIYSRPITMMSATPTAALADVVRDESYQVVDALHELDIEVAMLTGDSEDVAHAVAADLREEWPLLGLAIVGTIIGVAFLSWFSTGPIVPFLIGFIVLGYVFFQVVKNFVVIEEAHHPVALGGIGLLEGVLFAAANLGPVLPAYFHTFERDAERYIGGLSMTLGTIFATRIILMTFFTDLMTPYRLWLGSTIAAITIIGLLLGTYLRGIEIDEQKFTWFVIGLLFVISLNIFRNTVPALFF